MGTALKEFTELEQYNYKEIVMTFGQNNSHNSFQCTLSTFITAKMKKEKIQTPEQNKN